MKEKGPMKTGNIFEKTELGTETTAGLENSTAQNSPFGEEAIGEVEKKLKSGLETEQFSVEEIRIDKDVIYRIVREGLPDKTDERKILIVKFEGFEVEFEIDNDYKLSVFKKTGYSSFSREIMGRIFRRANGAIKAVKDIDKKK